jgi:hypothetical protein
MGNLLAYFASILFLPFGFQGKPREAGIQFGLRTV